MALHDAIEANGKTIKENNLAIAHTIPVGSLVEVMWDAWFGDGVCWKVHARLWVVAHERDCDGTPLYVLSRWKNEPFDAHGGFLEDRLTLVDVTDEIRNGRGALCWEQD